MGALVQQAINPHVTLGQLLAMLRNGEATVGAVRDILIHDGMTLATFDSSSIPKAALEIAIARDYSETPPSGFTLAVRGEAFIEGTAKSIMAFREL